MIYNKYLTKGVYEKNTIKNRNKINNYNKFKIINKSNKYLEGSLLTLFILLPILPPIFVKFCYNFPISKEFEVFL